ncbi:MAG: hypothetical protein HY913_16715 [Desulfomonile tiedjei]|nr:hypothetical protein [Desulfomonile tiedjei]
MRWKVFVEQAFQPATVGNSAQAGWEKLSQNKGFHASAVGAVREPPGIRALLEAPLQMNSHRCHSETVSGSLPHRNWPHMEG